MSKSFDMSGHYRPVVSSRAQANYLKTLNNLSKMILIDLKANSPKRGFSVTLRWKGATYVLGENHFLSNDGSSTSLPFPSLCREISRQLQSSKFLLSRSIPLHGIRSTYLPRKSSRHCNVLALGTTQTLYHVGIRGKISKSTLAYANERRDGRIYADLAQVLIRIAREAKTMTRKEILLKAIEKQIIWIQASEILGITARQMRRLKRSYEEHGYGGLRDYRSGTPRRKRIAVQTLQGLCRLKREVYPDFSVKHFHEYVVDKHQLQISYNWARIVLEEAGIVERAPARGKHRRRRERRPMTGMLLHLDGSTHTWIPSLPQWDWIVMMDDADSQILYGQLVPEEGTLSTLWALKHVLMRYGRFCELYHDCGSHFGRTSRAGEGTDEEQNGQVSRALKTLGIRQIFARSPQARGRSERTFGTIQGRLPQELRLQGIQDYEKANIYLQKVFLPQFNRQFTVKPVQPESAFIPLVGIDLKLLLSMQQQRIVRNDNMVTYKNVILQVPESSQRVHYVRCPVTVHEFPQGTWGISYQEKLLGEYRPDGKPIASTQKQRTVA